MGVTHYRIISLWFVKQSQRLWRLQGCYFTGPRIAKRLRSLMPDLLPPATMMTSALLGRQTYPGGCCAIRLQQQRLYVWFCGVKHHGDIWRKIPTFIHTPAPAPHTLDSFLQKLYFTHLQHFGWRFDLLVSLHLGDTEACCVLT